MTEPRVSPLRNRIGPDDVHVDVRCSVLIMRDDAVLLLGRTDHPRGPIGELMGPNEPTHWVLPGGRPHVGESMVACARREVREETGMSVTIGRCLFVLEVADADHRIIDLVFAGNPDDARAEPDHVEEHQRPAYVPLGELAGKKILPPIAGHIRGLRPRRDTGAAYLGNLWRPDDRTAQQEEQW